MDRKTFLKTAGTLVAGASVYSCAPVSSIINYWTNEMWKGDMYEFRNKHVPFDVYSTTERYEFIDEVSEILNNYDDKGSRELLPELDYGRKTKQEFIEKWTENANEYLDCLSDGKFQLCLENVDKIDPEDSYRKEKILNSQKKRFTMILTQDDFKRRYIGEYQQNGKFFLDPFNLQLDKENCHTFDNSAIHEMFHGFFGTNYHSKYKGIMYKNDTSTSFDLTDEESNHLGWPLGKKHTVLHPLLFRMNRRKTRLHITRL